MGRFDFLHSASVRRITHPDYGMFVVRDAANNWRKWFGYSRTKMSMPSMTIESLSDYTGRCISLPELLREWRWPDEGMLVTYPWDSVKGFH